MARTDRIRRGSLLVCVVVVVLLPAMALATQRQRRLKAGQYNAADATVEMFKAIEAGQIEVKLIPKDATQSRVLITNKTDRPLNVKLPDAFAGVPALAQGGFEPGGGALGGRDRNRRDSGIAQSFGGGMGGMMGGMGGMMGGGMWNVKPEAIGNFKVPTVCLEHGKKDPRPQIPYVIKPINKFTDNAEVQELCRMLGTGQLNQRAAQAAAWHFSNRMSWQDLAAKRLRFANGASRPYFSPAEIQLAMRIADTVTQRAKERKQPPSEKSDSLSRP